jgi:hypothetical protein
MINFSANVTGSSDGLPAAVGDGVTDDTTAIQAHITALGRGGTLLFPPGKYLVSGSGLTVDGGIRLVGASRLATEIYRPTDGNVITFLATAWGSELARLNVQACQGGATEHAVVIGPGAYVNLRESQIWGGKAALYNQGVDCLIIDCNIAGCTYNIISSGPNWYKRVKADIVFPGTGYAFVQVPSPAQGLIENHLDMCDFSGDFAYSLLIEDSNNEAATDFSGCVFSAPIGVTGARWTNFRGCEFGSSEFTNSAGTTSIGSSVAWVPLSVPGALDGGGNINIVF